MTYKLVDSGHEKKWEQFGPYLIERPCSQAIWTPKTKTKKPDAVFTRENGNKWIKKIPKPWQVTVGGIVFHLQITDFGHLGVFPEHANHFSWIQEKKPKTVLNLFAYSGGVTMAAAKCGASVCHLDASKKMVDWAKLNAELNDLENAPIRYIVDDALKFLRREVKRKKEYEMIVLDPPSFGRGKQGQVFKIETDIKEILECCRSLSPKYVLLSCHTPGITPIVLENLLKEHGAKKVESGEMVLKGNPTLPAGSYVKGEY